MHTPRLFPALATCLAVGLALGLATAPRAQRLLSYEPFDYGATSPTVLNGQDGGFGWAAPWLGVAPGFSGMGSWWPLDGAAGDVGPLASHGIEVATSYVNDTPVPWSSNSLMLDGGGYIELSPHVAKYQPMTRGTVSLWVKTTSALQKMAMLSFSNAPSVKFKGRHCSFMILRGNAALEMRGDYHSYQFELRSSVNVIDGNWHHIAYTSPGDGWVRIYVDGVEAAYRNEGFIGYSLDLDTVQIGRVTFNSNPQYAYVGQIDDIALWADALTAAEVQSLATQPPVALFGPGTPPGPSLELESLATASFPSGAYTATGLSPVANRLGSTTGLRAARMLEVPINYGTTQTFYLSFLVRRDDLGRATTGGEIQLATDMTMGTRVGWNSSAKWFAGLFTGGSQSQVTMLDQTTYFCVTKVDTTVGADTVWFKPYAPGETVHASESMLSGVGTGINNWAVSRVESRKEPVDHILITPIIDANGQSNGMMVDELRLGPTWESVTRHAFGSSCLNLQVGRSNRPLLGSTNFSVNLAGAQPSVPAFMILGQSSETWAGNNLPLSLSTFGAAAGCFLNVSLEVTVLTMTDTSGNAGIPVAIPNDPALVALPLFTQWVAADPTSTAQLPAGFSPAMAIQIGH